MKINLIILLMLAILLVIFTLQNAIGITISLFFWEIPDAPLVLILLISVLLGYVIAAFHLYPRVWALKKEVRELAAMEFKPESNSQAGQSAREKPGPEGIELDEENQKEDKGFFRE
jgi:lipopolysaccharide assembly protein A